MSLPPLLEHFFRTAAPLGLGDRVVVAFSGGPDSTALLWGLAEAAPRLGAAVIAAHLDHALDPGSAGRAEAARGIAGRLGVPAVVERRPVAGLRRRGESAEAAARRVRYGFLDEVRRAHGARWVATAHHRDDQAETVLLRLLYGSGLAGLAGIRPVDGPVVRPLLACGREDLRRAVEAAGLAPADDPTNRDLAVPRNRVRHLLLPALAACGEGAGTAPAADPEAELAGRLARLADRARGVGLAVEHRLAERLAPGAGGLRRGDLAALPEPLHGWALALLHRRAGAPYPAGRAARAELLRQLAGDRPVGCDCGGGWRWQEAGAPGRTGDGRIALAGGVPEPAPDRERTGAFSYTLQVPGEVAVPEIAARVRLRQEPVEPWMFRGAERRAALALPADGGGRVTVRNRRPGDRVLPLGAPGSRRLKDLLIDRRVPRAERDRLPLLCIGGRIAWVPGVTIDQGFRLPRGAELAWVAEVVPA